MSYVRDGAEIYRRSFAMIRAEADLERFDPVLERVVVRMIHACGMVDLAAEVDASAAFAAAGEQALLGIVRPVRRLRPAGRPSFYQHRVHRRLRLEPRPGVIWPASGARSPEGEDLRDAPVACGPR